MAKAFVKPVHSKEFGCPLKVRNPATGAHIKDEGELVELDLFIRRRIKEGSLSRLSDADVGALKSAKDKAEKDAKHAAEADAAQGNEAASDSAKSRKGQ